MPNPPLEELFYSSLVTEHIVPKGRDFAFKRWHYNLVETSKQYDGFLRCDLCPPLRCKDPVVKCKCPIAYKRMSVVGFGLGISSAAGIREGCGIPSRAARQDCVRKSKI
ncbi:MAG: hypothetical protein IM586_12165, partial [Pseudanabaena sp. M172S2SP2A07QC]|nr:hypothetical protein [Pseudanabaena sp. M172S2SP2A07QC]